MGYDNYLHTILLFFNKRGKISDHKWGQCLLLLNNGLVLVTDLPLYSSSLSKFCLGRSFIQLNRKCVARRMILTWKDLKTALVRIIECMKQAFFLFLMFRIASRFND